MKTMLVVVLNSILSFESPCRFAEILDVWNSSAKCSWTHPVAKRWRDKSRPFKVHTRTDSSSMGQLPVATGNSSYKRRYQESVNTR